MGKLLHGERSKSKFRCKNHAVKDENLLLVINRHFSKLKPGSNGDEDQVRALGNSGLSLSFSRNHFLSLKLGTPSLLLKIGLKPENPDSYGQATRPCDIPSCPCELCKPQRFDKWLQASYTATTHTAVWLPSFSPNVQTSSNRPRTRS
ncbi:unnamed protein product [Linum trigynum]|uniref:Uncharacterized protein n=1 Tax=Linum trigynum TaxID=586398 RepID=A0AAV2FXT7_9ROSI